MSPIYDISRTITPELAVWPGDTPFSAAQVMDRRAGQSVNLFTLTLSAHTGSHADAPFHFDDAGAHPAQAPLWKYIGPARLVTVERKRGGITPADLPVIDLTGTPRLLIRTWVSDVPDDRWPEEFPYPTVELVNWLAGQGGVLLGLDAPSVDDADSAELPVHHRLLYHQIVNLESLCLRGVPDGAYELIALPLRIDGVCGSPVRAILRD
jgi:arylformamidase